MYIGKIKYREIYCWAPSEVYFYHACDQIAVNSPRSEKNLVIYTCMIASFQNRMFGLDGISGPRNLFLEQTALNLNLVKVLHNKNQSQMSKTYIQIKTGMQYMHVASLIETARYIL